MKSCVFRGIKPSQCLEKSNCEVGKIEHFISGFGIKVIGYIVDRHFDKEIEEISGCNVAMYDDECMRNDGVGLLECIEKYNCFGLVEIEYESGMDEAGGVKNEGIEGDGNGNGNGVGEDHGMNNVEGYNDLEHDKNEKNIELDTGSELDQGNNELSISQNYAEEHEYKDELKESAHSQVPKDSNPEFPERLQELENYNYIDDNKINKEFEKLSELLEKGIENRDFNQIYTNLEKIKEQLANLEKEVEKKESNHNENIETHFYTPDTDFNENQGSQLHDTMKDEDLNAETQTLQSSTENTIPIFPYKASINEIKDLPQVNEMQVENTNTENEENYEDEKSEIYVEYQSIESDKAEECQGTVNEEGECQDEENDPIDVNLNTEFKKTHENNDDVNNPEEPNIIEVTENTQEIEVYNEEEPNSSEETDNTQEFEANNEEEPKNTEEPEIVQQFEANNVHESNNYIEETEKTQEFEALNEQESKNFEQAEKTSKNEDGLNDAQDSITIEKNNINEEFIYEKQIDSIINSQNTQRTYPENQDAKLSAETIPANLPPSTSSQPERNQDTNSPHQSLDKNTQLKTDNLMEDGDDAIEYTKTTAKINESDEENELVSEEKENNQKEGETGIKVNTDKFLKMTNTKVEECSQDCQNICVKKDKQKECMDECISNFCTNDSGSNSDYNTVLLTGIVLFLIVGIIYLFMQNKSMRMAIEHGEFGIATYSNISS